MHYFVESIVVGLYCVTIFWMLRPYILDKNVLFFLTGFSKHLFGWILGLQTYYCKFGNACERYNSGANTMRSFSFTGQMFAESLAEGFIFLLTLQILFKIANNTLNKYVILFLLGVLLHLSFELSGIHHRFCLESCSRNGY